MRNEKGYLGVIAVMIVAVITLGSAISITLLGTNELFYGYQIGRSGQALQLADTCAEEAYYRLKKDASYSGGTISFTEGSCSVTITEAGSQRTIQAEASIAGSHRTVSATVSLTGNTGATTEGIDLTSWIE